MYGENKLSSSLALIKKVSAIHRYEKHESVIYEKIKRENFVNPEFSRRYVWRLSSAMGCRVV
jgi:hypothetical protein